MLISLALLLFALAMVSITLHEIGHPMPVEIFRAEVIQYFVGSGRTIWFWKRGEAEYGFKLFPLGGYIWLIEIYPSER